MEYLQLSMDDYIQAKTEIRKELGGIVQGFVQIGWRLTRIDKSQAYKMDGYQTIAEFAKAEYGLSASTTSRFMKVYEEYSLPGDTPELKEQYRDYNSSQLIELLQIQEEDRQIFRSEVKRQDIREFQRFEKENENSIDNLLNWKEAKEPEEKLRATIQEFFRENREILNNLYAKDLQPNDLAELIAPSGSRSYRKGTVYMMFYSFEKGIMVKVFGEDPMDMSYRAFYDVTKSIFDSAAAGISTWDKYFRTPPEDPDTQDDFAEDTKIEEHIVEPNKTFDHDGKATEMEDQIPGQDNIQNHPEYMPEPEIAPAQKTEEQKYNEKQNKIDRETKKKLREMEDQEKMSHLPSDEPKRTKQLRMASTYYDDIISGRMTFWFFKNDNFHPGDTLNLTEFHEGRHTGRTIRTEITYILDDYTGLEDGYCILAIKVGCN